MKQTLLLLAFLISATCSVSVAQDSKKIDFQLASYLDRQHPADAMVDLFIHGQVDAVSCAVRASGGLVKMTMGRLVSARVPVANVRALAASQAVEGFEFSLERGELLNDSSRVKSRVDMVQAGLAPLPQAYDGEGVVIGFLDTGVDAAHPDFRNADNTSRIAYYWDQTLANGAGTPAGYGYGIEWTNSQINAGQMTSVDATAHGTTVAGAAAGNGLANGRHKGAAPKADIIAVTINFGLPNFRAVVADGVRYIFERAAAMGKPAVVNASLGSYSGSHDGKDAAALFIDSLITAERGRFLVCAAGNYGQAPFFHVRTEVGSDTSFTWYATNTNGPQNNLFPYPNVYFEVWADAAEFNNVQFGVGADRVTPSYQYRGRTSFRNIANVLAAPVTEPLMSTSGNQLGVVQYFAQQRGAQVLLQVHIASPDSGTYNWRFMSTGSGRFDVWSSALFGTSFMNNNSLPAPWNVPTVGEYAPIANYVMPDNDKHIVDSWACSEKTLTVANYWNLTAYTAYSGNFINSGATPYMISANSSAGPTRDLRWKPDIAAPGDVTMSPGPLAILTNFMTNDPDKLDALGMHMRNGGTSMASPVVAGAVALYLQKCPNASVEQIRQAFLSTTWGDALTGTLPNRLFGNGRVHAFNALVTSNLPDIAITADGTEMCSNATVDVTAPAGFDAYLWSNGSTDNPTAYVGEGPLTVVASTATGCAHSNALTFTLLDAPPTPIISANGSVLTSNSQPNYQWYLNGTIINGATAQVWTALVNGSYTVEVVAPNGCASMSAPQVVLISGLAEATNAAFAVWPSIVEGTLNVRIPAGSTAAVRVLVVDANGRSVLDKRISGTGVQEIDVHGLAAGSYALRVLQGELHWEARFVKVP